MNHRFRPAALPVAFSLAIIAGCANPRATSALFPGRAPDAGNVRLAKLFASHAVLQRDRPLPVWGWADPGGLVEAWFDGEPPQRAVADADGRWQVTFPPHPAEHGRPRTLTVAGRTTNTVSDVVFGDVWLCSGQSNMQFNLRDADNAAEAIAAADLPMLRQCLVRGEVARRPTPDFNHGGWVVSSPSAASNFTAVGFFFARELMERFDVPVGFLNASEGGTRIEAWTGEETLARFPFKAYDLAELDTLADGDFGARCDQFNERTAAYEAVAASIAALETNAAYLASMAAPELDDASWDSLDAPGAWEKAGIGREHFNGEAWYRRAVDIPAEWAGRELTLSLGAIDDIDIAFFDGVEIGRTGSLLAKDMDHYTAPRLYAIPAGLVKAGPVVLAVRVYDGMGEGGFRSPADSLWIAPDQGHDASSRLPLAGAWRFRATHPLPIPPGNPNNPNLACAFYNTFIHPLAPCAFRGAIWYQGESNSGNAWEYRELFPAMIQCWRDRWGRDFPFLWVQLASLGGPLGQPGDHDWAVVREAQSLALSLPKTAQVVSIDIGDPHDIHPRNKREVGRRLALAARAIEYGEKDLVYSGPVFAGMKVKGDTVRLRFRNVGGGLVAKDGPLSRFAIAGEDRRFVWGEAAIDGDTVVVRSPDVPEPVAVRYAWEIGPAGANLFNAEGLPASPFRTDDWPVATQPLPRRRSSDSPTLPSP